MGAVLTHIGAIEISDVLLAGGFAALGIIATIVTYQRTRSRPSLVFATYGNSVVRAAHKPEIEIRFRGRNVPRVSRTVVYVWNAGRGVVNAADVVEHDPIRLQFDGDVLDATIQQVTRSVNRFAVQVVAPNEVRIDFEFIDANDGLVVEVLHTGAAPLLPDSSSPAAFQALGTVKGLPEGLRKQRISPLDSEWAGLMLMLPAVVIAPLLITEFHWGLLIAAIAYAFLIIVVFIRAKRRKLPPAPIGTTPPNIRRAPRALLQSSESESNGRA